MCVHTVIIEGVKGIQQTLNWLIQCEVTKVMEYNQIGRILLLLESRHVPVLFLSLRCVRDCNSTSATPRVVRDKWEVGWGGRGQGICQLWDTHPPMRNFTHWSPDEPMTKFSRPKEGRARGTLVSNVTTDTTERKIVLVSKFYL